MKSILLVLPFFLIGIVNGQEKVYMNDENVVLRDVGNFSELIIKGPFKVYFSTGKNSLAISASSVSARERIQVKESGGTVTISLDNSNGKWLSSANQHFKVYVSSPTLKRIDASGAVDFIVTDLLKSSALMLNFSGASDFLGKLECVQLDAEFSGASDIEASGTADKLNARVSGASSFKAAALKTKEAVLEASGASNIKAAATDSLSANASGASNITYYGNPIKLLSKSSGASNVKKGS